jgi:Lipocalin-like domain
LREASVKRYQQGCAIRVTRKLGKQWPLRSRAAAFDETGRRRGRRIERGIRVIEETNHKLLGTWKLVSASSKTSKGEQIEPPYGARPVGFLSYTADGRVTSLISFSGRKLLSVGGETLAVQEEQAEAFKTFFAYAGRYTLSGDKVTHHVEISSIQNYVDKDLVRNIKFQDDRIILLTPPTLVNGKIQIIELLWQRMPVGS